MEHPRTLQYRSAEEPSVVPLGQFELNLGMRTLCRAGREISLGSRAFDILSAIVLAAGRVVTKDELMETVWPGLFVEENNIHVHLCAVRKALGDHRKLIDTVPGRGYRLRADSLAAECDRTGPTAPHMALSDNAQAVVATKHPLPRRRTLFGRDAALGEIMDRFALSRVVTLTGPAGVGKTCLAIEIAHHAAAAGERDVVFIDLEEPGSLAAVSSIGAAPSQSVDTLLVLDNADIVIDKVADIVERLVGNWHGLRVLLTSRERLRIAPETLYRVEPLALPPGDPCRDGMLQSPAVRLFMERASLRGLSVVDEQKLPLVAEICRRLDGLPLAIELAVGRACVLGLEGVRQRLEERFLLLADGYRTAQPRHQSLRAAFDWGFLRLTHMERAVYLRIARLTQSFTIDSMYSVVCDDTVDRATAVNCIAQLVEKSIVDVSFVGVTASYRLSESARTYALSHGSSVEQSNVVAQHVSASQRAADDQ